MKKLTYILSIAFLIACGGEKTDNRTAENAQNSNEPILSETQIAKDKNLSPKTASKENKECGYGSLTVSWDDPDKSGTNIRNRPNGKVIATIKPADYPDGCAFDIDEESNGWFKIKGGIQNPGSDDIELLGGQAWIHSSVISVGTRNYGGQTIQILDSPENGKSIGTITKESYGLRILSLCGSWVKISYNGISGWVSNEWICGIPWTNCS